MQEIQPGTYKHYKGGLYEVVALGKLHAGDDLEDIVIYRSLKDAPDYPAGSWWARPLAFFSSTVEIDGKILPRFIHINEKPLA